MQNKQASRVTSKEKYTFSASFTTQSARLEALPNAAATADIVALTLVDLTLQEDDDVDEIDKERSQTILHHLQLQLRCAARQNILKQTKQMKKPKMNARAMIPSTRTHTSGRFNTDK